MAENNSVFKYKHSSNFQVFSVNVCRPELWVCRQFDFISTYKLKYIAKDEIRTLSVQEPCVLISNVAYVIG